jgi:putative transposase
MYPIVLMCRLLGVSSSGYYAWRRRRPSSRAVRDRELRTRIVELHQESRGTYGSPRLHIDLQEAGERVSRKRVARLMKEAGVRGVCRRRKVTTTRRAPEDRPAPDLVNREFEAAGPNRLWVADITYIPTLAGFVYLAVVLDVWSRRIVGWSMRRDLAAQIVLEAITMALTGRDATGVIHHSDQGCQYTSLAFGERCRVFGVRPSMGSVGDCYDNAMCESFFATLECELIDRERFATQADAERAVFEYIEGFYNPRRRHSALGMVSPLSYELANWPEQDASGSLATRFRRTTMAEPVPGSASSAPAELS